MTGGRRRLRFCFARPGPRTIFRSTWKQMTVLAQNQALPKSPALPLDELRRMVGPANVVTAKEDLIPYSFDGTAALRQMPGCVVFVQSAEQISAVLKLANQQKLAVVPRGSGTGLSGGSLPSDNCIVLCTVRMDRVLELDKANLTMLVEPGVTTLKIADAAAAEGLFYPPDPGSMRRCRRAGWCRRR